MHSILMIGGTGAQGAAVVRHLSATGNYEIKVLTRDTESRQAKELAFLSNVSLLAGPKSGFEETSLFNALSGLDYVFVNTDGFSIGQQAETYWGIRIFELARRAGIKHFLYSGLDYLGPKSKYDPKFNVGHYNGKAYVAQFMASQPTAPMAWSVISSGPYMEALSEAMVPTENVDGSKTFRLPLAEGAIPFIHLADLAAYVDWIFAHPTKSNGLNLEIATVHATGADIAIAFTAVTGKPATYVSIPISAWNDAAWKNLPQKKHTKIGFRSVSDDRALLMTYEQNFTAWWELYQASAGNKGLITRDYELLDRILPGRVKSVEEWMRKTNYTGEWKALLKRYEGLRKEGKTDTS